MLLDPNVVVHNKTLPNSRMMRIGNWNSTVVDSLHVRPKREYPSPTFETLRTSLTTCTMGVLLVLSLPHNPIVDHGFVPRGGMRED